MPVKIPGYCDSTPEDAVISRFLPLPYFHDLFANQELYFRRVDKFKESDPQEALPEDDFVRRARGLVAGDINDEQELRAAQGTNRQFSESAFISCWHLHDAETLRMWDSYGDAAIFTTFSRLRGVLGAFLDDVHLGPVKYGGENLDRYNTVRFLFTKQRYFDNERELRVVLMSYDPVAGMNRHYNIDNRVHREPLDDVNPLHDWVHDHKRRRVNLAELVTEIRVSPWASDEVFADVKTFGNARLPACPVNWSELRGPLTPTREQYRNPASGWAISG